MSQKIQALQALAEILDEKDALGNFVEAVKATSFVRDNEDHWHKVRDVVDYTITWSDTEQGAIYWQDIHHYVKGTFDSKYNILRYVEVCTKDLFDLGSHSNIVKDVVNL